MQERVLPRGWIERRSVEHYSVHTPRSESYGKPTYNTFDQSGIWTALTLHVLMKPNCSRMARTRKASPIK